MIILSPDIDPHHLSFIRQTYMTLLISLASMLMLGVFSYYALPSVSRWPLGLLDSLIWIACGWFGLRQPIKILLPIFVLITGLLFGQLAHLRPQLFIASSLLTVMVFSGLTAYVFSSRRDFSFLRSSLGIGFWVLLVGGLLMLLIKVSVLSLLMGLIGTALFVGWILYDTDQILSRMDGDYEPAVGAFDLIMDIVGLRSSIERVMSYFD